MDLTTKLCIERMRAILHSEGTIKDSEWQTEATFANPAGGAPVRVQFGSEPDVCVRLGKTPRYYPADGDGRDKMLHDLEDYAAGRIVTLSYTRLSGETCPQDRVVPRSALDGITLDGLVALCLKTGLATGDEIRDVLAAGGCVEVHGWNSTQDFSLVQKDGGLQRLS
jgi:hypothetical protein